MTSNDQASIVTSYDENKKILNEDFFLRTTS